ncbi:unnamed protein product [Strongylus vulgaris]|uniref:Uncharacterized protein n=1 Tax=Strongylus vulgaris TaxID=40348 RepID=A0A3P7KF23_STRVU|nr:unnamed protein product [Strongylus vulgaris]
MGIGEKPGYIIAVRDPPVVCRREHESDGWPRDMRTSRNDAVERGESAREGRRVDEEPPPSTLSYPLTNPSLPPRLRNN